MGNHGIGELFFLRAYRYSQSIRGNTKIYWVENILGGLPTPIYLLTRQVENNTQSIMWPSQPPNFNIIWKLSNFAPKCLTRSRPFTMQHLIDTLQLVLASITIERIRDICQSMPWRVRAVIGTMDYPIKHSVMWLGIGCIMSSLCSNYKRICQVCWVMQHIYSQTFHRIFSILAGDNILCPTGVFLHACDGMITR